MFARGNNPEKRGKVMRRETGETPSDVLEPVRRDGSDGHIQLSFSARMTGYVSWDQEGRHSGHRWSAS